MTPKKLYKGQPSNAGATLFTTPANKKTIVKQIWLSNTTAVAATVSLEHKDSGDAAAAAAADQIIDVVSIAASDVTIIDCVVVMDAGDFMWGTNGTSGSITVAIYGYEVAA